MQPSAFVWMVIMIQVTNYVRRVLIIVLLALILRRASLVTLQLET